MTVAASAPRAGTGEGVLDPFLRPRGIALVGASRNQDAITARPCRYLRDYGYDGDVVVVNRNAEGDLYGYPVVPSLEEAAGRCDVALVMVPARHLVAALEDCLAGGVTHALSIASGFEAEAGAALRADLLAFLAQHPELRLVGPNSAGLISTPTPSILSFSSVLLQERMTVGRVGLVTQSGAVGNGLHLALLRRGAGLAHWVSTGNELDLGAVQVAATLLTEPSCAAVGMFLEGMTDAEHLELLRERIAATGKPVVALRAGGSPLGRQAAFGHTGRVIGDDEIARAAMQDAGVRLVDTLEELCDVLTVLSALPPRTVAQPPQVGIVTVSGGTGVIAADAVAQATSLVLRELTDDAAAAIAADTDVPVPVANPYDVPVLGDPEVFSRAIRAMTTHGGCDAVLAIVSTLAHDYDMLAQGPYDTTPPIVFAHLSPEERFTPEQARRLAQQRIPTVPSPRNAVRALADWARSPAAGAAAIGSGHAPPTGPRWGLVTGAERLGPSVRTWMPPAAVVESADDAVAAAHRCGTPVVIKADGTTISHRTELGAVRVNLVSDDEIRSAFEQVAAVSRAHGDAVVVQGAVSGGLEVLVSVIRDPEVGVVALCRPGGVFVELGGTNTILTGRQEHWMARLAGTPVGRLLAGYRAAPAADAGALVALVGDLVAAVQAEPLISGVECNPVIVHPAGAQPGASLVDLTVVLAEAAEGVPDADPRR